MLNFKGKTIVITGAARGIGKNIAARFASLGARVVIIDMNRDLLETTAQEFTKKGWDVLPSEFDLTKTHRISEYVTNLIKRYGSVDILVNNAKAYKHNAPLSETVDNFDLAVDVSLKAPLFFSQSMINEITVKAGAVQPRWIVNISSVVAGHICRESAGYHLTKASLENLTRYLAVHGGDKGVRVNAIRPGFIVQDEHRERYSRSDNKTYRDMSRFCHPLKCVGRSDDIADATMFLCSPMARFITGQVLTVDGGLTLQDQWDLIKRFQEKLEK